ncbi:response regulator [Desulfovibrio inopinatus]|uniref:response regulator n=1 Tax=Desulfovibrio inopinatus TaxID=102109 RepID=UPI000410E866|nr:response regulator [Desulfovibrio inopinatus]
MNKSISVLLVDDEPGLLDFLSKRLRLRGFNVDIASGGREALKSINLKQPDVVVLDMLMPEMDGLTTLKEIRSHFPEVEVLLLTAHASTESALRGMELGAYDYLLKPVVFEELIGLIEDASGTRGIPEEKTDRSPVFPHK